MSDQKKPEPSISVSPEPTIWSEVGRAYRESGGAVGSRPLLFLDKAASGVSALALRGLRSVFSAEADSSLTNIPSSAIAPIIWAASGDWARSGDQQVSAGVEKKAEEFFAGKSRPKKFGDYDLRMAAGWTPKGPLKINGVMVGKPETVTNLLAVFVRDKDGNVELLDPSVKMNSLGEVTALPKALWGKAQNDADKRWKETAGTFVEVQLATSMASLGVGALTKAADIAGTKIPKMAQLAETARNITSRTQAAVGPVSGLTAASGLSAVAGAYAQSSYFSPKAVQDVVDAISGALSQPEKLNPRQLRQSLNSALREHSFNEGSNAKQVYVPSLRSGDDPFKRLDALLDGRVAGYEKPKTPWQEWTPNPKLTVGDIKSALKSDAGFQKTFLGIAEKAFSGAQLSDAEIFVLRVKMNMGEHFSPLTGKESGPSQLKYSEEEKQDTLKKLKLDLRDDLIERLGSYPKIAGQVGVSREELRKGDFLVLQEKVKPSDQTLLEFVQGEKQQMGKGAEPKKDQPSSVSPSPKGP